MSLRTALERTENVLLVLVSTASGLWLPRIELISTLTVPIVIALIYISLRGVERETLSTAIHPFVIVAGLGISYIVLPAGAFVLGSSIADDELRIGLYIIAAVPTTAGSSIVWTRLSKGNVELASFIAVSSILLSPFLTPVVLSTLVGSTVALSPGPIIIDLLIIIGGGALLRFTLPRETFSESQITAGARIAIALLVYSSVSQLEFGQETMSITPVLGSVLLLLLLGLVASAVVHYALQLAPDVQSAMVFSGTLKNLGVGILIAELLAIPAAVVIIVTYYILQQLLGALAAEFVFNTG